MTARRLAAALLALVAACDAPTVITHVFRLPNIRESDLVAMQGPGGIPVEIHGRPWAGADPAELAGAMTGPAGAAAIRFKARPVTGPTAHGARVVLHFTPVGAPSGPADCARTAEAATGTPPAKGFAVNMTFCRGAEVEAQGFLRALETEPGDYAAFSTAMRQLLLVVFREEKDR